MSTKYNVVGITGTYEDKGVQRKRYENVGAVIEKDGKFYLKLHKLVFHDDGHLINFFGLYPPKENSPQAKQAKQAAQSKDDFDDDIPF